MNPSTSHIVEYRAVMAWCWRSTDRVTKVFLFVMLAGSLLQLLDGHYSTAFFCLLIAGFITLNAGMQAYASELEVENALLAADNDRLRRSA